MDLSCPICAAAVDFEKAQCRDGHTFKVHNGVLELVRPENVSRLAAAESRVQDYRVGAGIRPRESETSLFSQLPNVDSIAGLDRRAWRVRRQDLDFLDRVLARRPPPSGNCLGDALDLGAWNGWLSHHLARAGWNVLAVDYFVDPLDGLGAQQHFEHSFEAVQMDLEELSVLGCFDVIVVNRCLGYFKDPVATTELLVGKLNPGGVLIISGLHVRLSATEAARTLTKFEQKTFEPLFFTGSKNYLDTSDAQRLESLGIRLHATPRQRLGNLLRRIRRSGPQVYSGLLRA